MSWDVVALFALSAAFIVALSPLLELSAGRSPAAGEPTLREDEAERLRRKM